MKLRQYRRLKQYQIRRRLVLTPEVFWGPCPWTLIEEHLAEWRNGFPKSWTVDDRPSKRNIPDQ